VRLLLATLVAVSALATSVLPVAAQGHYRRAYPYGYDEYGRSTDPNCYRGPNRVYVCGGSRRGYGYDESPRYRRGPSYGYDQYGRSTDPNCYRGPRGVYVC
jgi:hypothetical protein